MPKYCGKQIFSLGRFPKVGQKQKTEKNTPGTAGGQGGRDRTLAIKSRKNAPKSPFWPRRLACAMRACVRHAYFLPFLL